MATIPQKRSDAAPYIIVVGIDYSELGDAALDTAVRLASLHEHAEIHPVHVERDFREDALEAAALGAPAAPHTETALDKLEKHCSGRLQALMPPAPLEGDHRPPFRVERVITHVRLGPAANQIVQLAVDVDADLIVVGTHSRKGLERWVMGSVAERVLRTARCPVFVARRKDHENVGDVPEIEPPCPACVEARMESGGEVMWCSRHSNRRLRPHRYTYSRSTELSAPSSRSFGQSTP